jgi:MoxR-like ATPase
MLDLKDLFQPKTSIILTGLMTKRVEAYMSKAKRIFIVGQSGAGKGVVAEEVAKQLGWKFINADVLASVASIGRSVTDVFGAGSEDKFNQT